MKGGILQVMKQDVVSIQAGSLDRYGPIYRMIEGCLFAVGILFWLDATNGQPGFSQQVWGDFAYSIPAVYWAAANMGAAAITLIGLINPVHKQKVLFGASLHIAQHAALSFSAVFTGGEYVIGVYASVLLLPLHIAMAAGALAEWKR